MASLKTVGSRFETILEVIENGSGYVTGELTEADQGQQPSNIFVAPSQILRQRIPTALQFGMVLRSRAGDVYIVGDNGPSENRHGGLWQSFRLFQATGQYLWQRREQVIDPITKRLRDTGQLQTVDTVWAAIESLERPLKDGEMHFSFAQYRIVTGAPIKNDDIIDNRTISKVDKQLGLSIGTVT